MRTTRTTNSAEKFIQKSEAHLGLYDELSYSDGRSAGTPTQPHSDRRGRLERRSKPGGELDAFGKTADDKENEDEDIKFETCIRRITAKFNQNKSFGSFEFNKIERSALKERLVHSGNFHLPVDQMLNKELNYHCFSFSTYFKYASLCYYNLVDERLRPQIYGFLNRERVVRLLSGTATGSYLITFNQSVLSTLTLNYLERGQLVELLFFESNLRNDDLNAYLKSNKQHLKHPIIKGKF